MENVTLTPKEQARLQVLNSLLAEHMTLDQAAAPEDRRGPWPRQGSIEAASNLAYHQPAVVQNLPAVGIHLYLQAVAR